MRTNMGIADRLIRTVIALSILVLYFMGIISGVVAIIGIVLSVIFLVTSMMSFCPLYKLFNFSTK
ncbi:MAG: DUF2892 domain-containing protein [Bacteroidetes bacterium]|nr:DUF2892 domain-containing protein [Bacteroidota bacterium]MBU1372479.1 DUF2892 domain-containing protein [Bacteroidota bacterium]MBU1485112.1 DUF2892 domain-containing protein [Bacteroidota bacterium]MBU1761509.1 DUF2892 domain-containing protein [Bacteroidota bacterium]MBU2045111.1 DUF2892 domain-containing protein [Bacteroidota bacterium]